MNGALVRFLALPLPDQAATVEALVLLCAVRVRLSILSQARVSAWIGPMLDTSGAETPASTDALCCGTLERVRSAVTRTSRRVPRATCLVQAIAGRRMLEARGIAACIRIGVEKIDGKVGAHAWLTVGEKTVLGGADASVRFVQLRPPH